MADRRLLVSQRNQVFELVRRSGFDLSNFTLTETRSHSRDTIINKLRYAPNEDFYFTFEFSDRGRASILAPGKEEPVDALAADTFQVQLLQVTTWLQYLKRETAAPDLWAEWEKALTASRNEAAGRVPTAPFSADELREVRERLAGIEAALFAAFQLSEEHRAFVQSEFAYLRESAERSTRRDWYLQALGTCVNIGVAVGQSSDIVPWLLRAVFNAWTALHGGGPALPP